MTACKNAKLHCLSLLRLQELLDDRGWRLEQRLGSSHQILISPQGSHFELTLAAQTRTPSAKPCTFLAQSWQPLES